MTMGQQETIKPSKTGAAAQQQTLGTLSAIHQDAVPSCLDEKGPDGCVQPTERSPTSQKR